MMQKIKVHSPFSCKCRYSLDRQSKIDGPGALERKPYVPLNRWDRRLHWYCPLIALLILHWDQPNHQAAFSMTLNSLYENKPSKDKTPLIEEETGTITPVETSTTRTPWWAHINKRRKRPTPMPPKTNQAKGATTVKSPKPHKDPQLSPKTEAVKYSQEVPAHIRFLSLSLFYNH